MNYFEKLYVHKYQNIIINAPVQLMESAIIKDTVDNKILLRNIFTNVGSTTIIAIILEGKLYDVTGELISEGNGNFSYTYQDIKIEPNDLFGNTIPIPLPNEVRKIDISIKKIVTEAGDVISYQELKRITPDKPEHIEIPENYLETLDTNTPSPIVYPLFKDDYWQCTCGRINWNNDICCGLCKRQKENQQLYKKDNLQKSYDAYIETCKIKKIEEEQKRREEEERLQKERKEQEAKAEKEAQQRKQAEILRKRKNLRALVISSGICLFIGLTLLLIFIVIPNIKLSNRLKDIQSLETAGKYQEAIDAYKELDESKYISQINECKYNLATEYINNHQYDEAIECYNDIMNHANTKENVQKCNEGIKESKYLLASDYENNGDLEEASKLFYDLGNYKDSYNRYIACKIDVGYIAMRASESDALNTKAKTEQYYKNEAAYRIISVDRLINDIPLQIWIISIDDGKTVRLGKYEFYGDKTVTKLGDEIIGMDSDLYIFTNVNDYNNDDYEKAIIHKSIKYNDCKSPDDKSIDYRDGITITTGFCEYNSDKDNIIPKESYTIYKNNAHGFEKYGKSYIKVDGLTGDEELDLYVIFNENFEDSIDNISTKTGEYVFTAQDNCFIGACTPLWAMSDYYGGSATMYVFTDYAAYMKGDLKAAIATGSIIKIDGYPD